MSFNGGFVCSFSLCIMESMMFLLSIESMKMLSFCLFVAKRFISNDSFDVRPSYRTMRR